jgi:hypothetical protein
MFAATISQSQYPDGLRASGNAILRLCYDRRLALDVIEPIAVADHAATSACIARRSGSGWLSARSDWNTDVGGSGYKMRLDAISNPIRSAPYNNRVD